MSVLRMYIFGEINDRIYEDATATSRQDVYWQGKPTTLSLLASSLSIPTMFNPRQIKDFIVNREISNKVPLQIVHSPPKKN